MENAEEGLWRLSDGGASAVAAVGPPSPAEYRNPLATGELLASLVDASRGTSRWLNDGTPAIRAIAEGQMIRLAGLIRSRQPVWKCGRWRRW